GTRRDGVTARPEFADLLSSEDQALWSRQNIIVSSLAEANRKMEDAKRILGRARRTEGVDIRPLEVRAVQCSIQKFIKNRDLRPPRAAA
ncbi:MAG: hypothetical protein WBV25_04025, partial [Methylocella sp.]